ncbi:MAG: LysR family transcriptional regulator, partial [Gammaproteobacteria bacterium]
MDTELARTFLSVVAAGNFVKAAEKLCVTQSTVSARIQSLE